MNENIKEKTKQSLDMRTIGLIDSLRTYVGYIIDAVGLVYRLKIKQENDEAIATTIDIINFIKNESDIVFKKQIINELKEVIESVNTRILKHHIEQTTRLLIYNMLRKYETTKTTTLRGKKLYLVPKNMDIIDKLIDNTYNIMINIGVAQQLKIKQENEEARKIIESVVKTVEEKDLILKEQLIKELMRATKTNETLLFCEYTERAYCILTYNMLQEYEHEREEVIEEELCKKRRTYKERNR